MDALVEYLMKVDGGRVFNVICMIILWDLRNQFKKMSDNIAGLTVQLATLGQKVDSQEKRLDRIEGI